MSKCNGNHFHSVHDLTPNSGIFFKKWTSIIFKPLLKLFMTMLDFNSPLQSDANHKALYIVSNFMNILTQGGPKLQTVKGSSPANSGILCLKKRYSFLNNGLELNPNHFVFLDQQNCKKEN